MSHGDVALLVIGCAFVALALIGLIGHWVRSDYQFSLSLRIAKRNPPQPKAPKAAEQVAPVTDISTKGAAA